MILLLGFMFAHAFYRDGESEKALHVKREQVKRLNLTDLCLFTEASYTRNLTQADRHTPFQNHPFSLEHFPSGSLLGPPIALKRKHDPLD